MMHELSADELIDVNDQCRRYVGKSLEHCDRDDLNRVHAALTVEAAFLRIVRAETVRDMETILARARRRSEPKKET